MINILKKTDPTGPADANESVDTRQQHIDEKDTCATRRFAENKPESDVSAVECSPYATQRCFFTFLSQSPMEENAYNVNVNSNGESPVRCQGSAAQLNTRKRDPRPKVNYPPVTKARSKYGKDVDTFEPPNMKTRSSTLDPSRDSAPQYDQNEETQVPKEFLAHILAKRNRTSKASSRAGSQASSPDSEQSFPIPAKKYGSLDHMKTVKKQNITKAERLKNIQASSLIADTFKDVKRHDIQECIDVCRKDSDQSSAATEMPRGERGFSAGQEGPGNSNQLTDKRSQFGPMSEEKRERINSSKLTSGKDMKYGTVEQHRLAQEENEVYQQKLKSATSKVNTWQNSQTRSAESNVLSSAPKSQTFGSVSQFQNAKQENMQRNKSLNKVKSKLDTWQPEEKMKALFTNPSLPSVSTNKESTQTFKQTIKNVKSKIDSGIPGRRNGQETEAQDVPFNRVHQDKREERYNVKDSAYQPTWQTKTNVDNARAHKRAETTGQSTIKKQAPLQNDHKLPFIQKHEKQEVNTQIEQQKHYDFASLAANHEKTMMQSNQQQQHLQKESERILQQQTRQKTEPTTSEQSNRHDNKRYNGHLPSRLPVLERNKKREQQPRPSQTQYQNQNVEAHEQHRGEEEHLIDDRKWNQHPDRNYIDSLELQIRNLTEQLHELRENHSVEILESQLKELKNKVRVLSENKQNQYQDEIGSLHQQKELEERLQQKINEIEIMGQKYEAMFQQHGKQLSSQSPSQLPPLQQTQRQQQPRQMPTSLEKPLVSSKKKNITHQTARGSVDSSCPISRTTFNTMTSADTKMKTTPVVDARTPHSTQTCKVMPGRRERTPVREQNADTRGSHVLTIKPGDPTEQRMAR